MKKRLLLVIIFVLLTSGIAYATANINGSFAGLPIVKVVINGVPLVSDVPGVVLKGRTLLPARAIAESLNSIVSWDSSTRTASISKPSVNLISLEKDLTIENDDSWTLETIGANFDDVRKDGYINLYYNIGPMERMLYEYRLTMLSPDGDVVATSETEENVIDNYGLMGMIYMDNLRIEKPGNYVFAFQIKYNDKFETVAEKIIIVE